MKSFIAALVSVFFAFVAPVGAADFWTEVKVTNKNGGSATRQITGGGTGEGWFAFGQVAEGGYRQVYAGPRFNPTSWSEVGIAVGVETVGDGWRPRFGSYAWAGRGDFSALVIYEDGAVTGPWHKAMVSYSLTPDLTVGIQTKKYSGNGLTVEYKINEAVSFRVDALEKNDVVTKEVAIKIKF